MKGNAVHKQNKRKVDKLSSLERMTGSYLAWPIFLIFTFLIYGQLLGFYLGKFDEDLLVLGNLGLLGDFANIKMAFLRDAFLSKQGATFYRPLQTLTFMVDAHFFFKQGSVFYFTNILIHGLTGCALFYLLGQLRKNSNVAAFFLTLLFLAAPLFVHAVAWAPSRGDLLIGLFGVLTMIFFLRFIRSGNWLFGALTALMFALALFSKETAIVLPVIMVIFYFMPEQEHKITHRHSLMLSALMVLVAVVYFYLRSYAVKASVPAEFGLMSFIGNLRTLPEFIAKFFLPFSLAPMAGFTLFNTLVGIILAGLLIWLIIRSSRPGLFYMLAGLSWFLLFALPGVMYSHTLGSAAYDYLEHRAYLPVIGLIIVLFFLLESPSNVKIQGKLTALMIAFILGFAVYAHLYAKNYENPMVFYNHAIKANPRSAMAYLNRGIVRSDFKDYDKALADDEKAIELFPGYAQAWVNKGIILAHYQKMEAAMAAYDSAIKYKPDLFQAHYNKANVLIKLGRQNQALKEYDIAIGLNPDYIPAYSARAIVRYQVKDYTGAINDLNRVIKNDPGNATAYLNRGKMWFKINKGENACSDWNTALNLGESQAKPLVDAHCKVK